MTKQFSKGQFATLIENWDNKGTYVYTFVTVRSCGNKRMHLINAETGEDLGRNFAPSYAIENMLKYNTRMVTPINNEEEVQAFCLYLATHFIASQKAECEKRMQEDISDPKYWTELLAELHEPKVLSSGAAMAELTNQLKK